MNVITRRRILEFSRKHPAAAAALDRWYRVAEKAAWKGIGDVRLAFPHADLVKVTSGNTVTVFNIAGNNFRLVAAVHYNARRLYVLRVLTHDEYSKEAWKKSL